MIWVIKRTSRETLLASRNMNATHAVAAALRGSQRAGRFAACGPLAAIAFAVWVGGCFRPYARSEFDPKGSEFAGITAHWAEAPSSRVRVLFVHGMCSHDEERWVTHGWDDTVVSYFGIAPSDVTVLPELPSGRAHIVQREYHIGAGVLAARFLIWSALTAGEKAAIQFDDPPPPPGEFGWKRATLNGELKKNLLNDCFSDAVIYAGARGHSLSLEIRDAVCLAFDGTPSVQGCDFPPAPMSEPAPLIILTESLGSRMVFDALMELAAQASARGEAALEAFDRAVAPVSEVFMLANQIPLLALAEAPGEGAEPSAVESPSRSTLIRGVRTLAQARQRHRARNPRPGLAAGAEPPITLVAFTDPNDLLSYRLPADPVVVGPLVRVVNVITSNDGALLGYVENPNNAHLGYRRNLDVLRLLFGGSARAPPVSKISRGHASAAAPSTPP